MRCLAHECALERVTGPRPLYGLGNTKCKSQRYAEEFFF